MKISNARNALAARFAPEHRPGSSPWSPHLRSHSGRYAITLASIAASLPLSLMMVVLVAYAFNQLQNPLQTLAWIDLVGEHASRWLRPWVRGTEFEAGVPVDFQTRVFAPALVVVAVLTGGLKFLQEYLLEDVGERIAADVRHALTDAYAQLPYGRASLVEGALLASVVGEDAREVRQTFTRLWGSIPADGLACVMYAAFLALLDTQLFALLIAIMLPAGVVIRVAGKSLKRLARQGLKSQSDLLEALLEKMRGWQTIQVLGGVERELRSFNVTNDRLFTVWRRSARAKALASPLVEWLGIVAAAFVIVLALRRIAEGALSPSVLTAFLVTIAQLANAGQTLSQQLQSARKGTEALRRAQGLVVSWVGAAEARRLLSRRAHASKREGSADATEKLRIESVETRGLSIARPGEIPGAAEQSASEGGKRTFAPVRPLAEGIDLSLARGDFLAVSGPSGAGKSTLLRVLLGLEPAASGSVHLNGIPVSERVYERAALDLAFLPQEPFLVEGSVLENVAYPERVFPHPGAPEAVSPSAPVDQESHTNASLRKRATAALAKANLAHKDLDARVFGLSGGERQRLMFARAFFSRGDASGSLTRRHRLSILRMNPRSLGCLRAESSRHIVVSVAHRDSVKALATRRLDMGEGQVPQEQVPAPG